MESRLLDFIGLLQEHPQGLPVQTLAEKLGVRRQSVYRLRDKALALGIWVVLHKEDPNTPKGWLRLEAETPDAGGRAKGVQGPGRLVLGLKRSEIEALRTALDRVRHLSPLAQKALARLLDPGEWRRLREEEPVVYSPLVDQYPQGLFERVAQAIRERRTCRVTYRNAKGEVKTYLFDPYLLVARDPHLYLVGANHNSRKAGYDPIQELRLDQIQDLALTRGRFPKPAFDARTYVRSRFRAFGGEGPPVRVRVRFAPEKAGFIRRTHRHPTQRVEDLPDGSVVWEVEVPLSEDLVHFILGYGPYATVLEPEELRRRVVAWARGALEANVSPKGVTVPG